MKNNRSDIYQAGFGLEAATKASAMRRTLMPSHISGRPVACAIPDANACSAWEQSPFPEQQTGSFHR